MIYFIIGVAVGAAFSPFWIKLWFAIKAKARDLSDKK